MSATPTLSLGLPVFNGVESGIDQLVDRLLNDSFDDFELIISDNGSTDGTADLLTEFARLDERVKVSRFDENQGVFPNYNKTLELATADLFKWCAVGDFLDDGYLERCVSHMKAQPETTIAHALYDFNDGKKRMPAGSHWRRSFDRRIVKHTSHRLPAVRVAGNLRHFGYGGHFYGIMRTALLSKLGGHLDHAGSDRVITTEMAAMGPIHWEPEVLWNCYCPPTEIDYREYGLKDGPEYPNINLEVLGRNNFGHLSTAHRLSVSTVLKSRYQTTRVIDGVRRRLPEKLQMLTKPRR